VFFFVSCFWVFFCYVACLLAFLTYLTSFSLSFFFSYLVCVYVCVCACVSFSPNFQIQIQIHNPSLSLLISHSRNDIFYITLAAFSFSFSLFFCITKHLYIPPPSPTHPLPFIPVIKLGPALWGFLGKDRKQVFCIVSCMTSMCVKYHHDSAYI